MPMVFQSAAASAAGYVWQSLSGRGSSWSGVLRKGSRGVRVAYRVSSHLSATKGYIQVPSLETSSLAKHSIVGALSLCSAALQHALNLIKSGDVKLKALANAKVATRDVHTPVKFNMASGKDSKTACAFSDQNWGMPMRKFTSTAQRRSTTQLQGMIELALSSLAVGQELDPDALSDAESDDEYALICRFFLFFATDTYLY
ncbi:hypothetical protein BKA83DRAFT_4126224 [Pisolithus microcarpus]|nr:hypothetical protein BKA83DRAFT_4126224 [Pisolithus microcarpus]